MNTHNKGQPTASRTHIRLLSTILMRKDSAHKVSGKIERGKKPVGAVNKELAKATVHGNSTQRSNQKPQIG